MDDVTLSALLDGECSDSELDGILRRLEREPALRTQLARMSLARDARRGVRVNPAHLDFASRVMAALPARPDAATAVPRPAPAARRMAWRPAAALAAAAAFGAVAVLVLKPQPAGDAPVPVAEVATAPTPAADIVPVALDEQDRRQLRRYLISHSESRAAGMGGTLGYARYAAYADDASDAVNVSYQASP